MSSVSFSLNSLQNFTIPTNPLTPVIRWTGKVAIFIIQSANTSVTNNKIYMVALGLFVLGFCMVNEKNKSPMVNFLGCSLMMIGLGAALSPHLRADIVAQKTL